LEYYLKIINDLKVFIVFHFANKEDVEIFLTFYAFFWWIYFSRRDQLLQTRNYFTFI